MVVGVSVMVGGDRQIRQITVTMPAPPAPDGEDDDRPPPLLVRHLNINTAEVERENFDRWLFADAGSEAARKRYLDDVLRTRVEAAAREHKLTEAQRAKLRLAGRGDIKRFFDDVEERRSQFEVDRKTFRAGLAALRRLEPLTQVYREGPFGEGSLFAKTLHRINDDRGAGQ
jgi:hypothetical protein